MLLLSQGCDTKRPVVSEGTRLQAVTLMLNWYPEAEHGGFYAAKELGIFEQYGLDVTIRAGGPNAPVAQELVSGRVQFAIGNADDVLLFRNEGVPVVALMAPIQNTPRCVLVRANSSATHLSELSGFVLQANAGRPFLDFMRAQGLLEAVQVVPYGGSVAKLVSDDKTAIQAYSFSEPFMAREQG
ncbi:MAG: ABC transporter substrate-binding protein, partial [Aureliella sp.]